VSPIFVDALARSEFFELDLTGENRGFVVIEKSKERDIFLAIRDGMAWQTREC